MRLVITFLVLAAAVSAKIVGTRRWTYNGHEIVGKLEANEPTICDTVKQYSGYFSAGGNKKYFYWFFESRSSPSTDALTMWLSGGPGCSSMLALFAENGPCRVDASGTATQSNQFSWNVKSNLLYVDQPPGTGFSTGTHDHGEDGVATDMYNFLQAFIATYSQYFKNGYYLFGESYAGHYVPAISYKIFQGNQAGTDTYIPLKGIAIGNGLTDPQIQYAYYPQMAYNSTTAPRVIGSLEYNFMKNAVPKCTKEIGQCQTTPAECLTAYQYCNEHEVTPVQLTGINLYDLREKCQVPPLCYNLSNIDVYLNQASVQQQLGVSSKWQSCSRSVTMGFEGDWMKDYQTKIPPQLENGTKVLIYAGDQDFICNWLGNQAWALNMKWSGQEGFNKAAVIEWNNNGKQMGKLRAYAGMNFLQVFKAGHMVPMNQPEASLYMLNQFIAGVLGRMKGQEVQ